jgi:hypothetical protein
MIAAAFLVLASGRSCLAATNEAPGFKEVYELIQAHLKGVSAADLNRAAVQGLLKALGPKVALVTNASPGGASAVAATVSKATLFDGKIAYIRVAAVGPKLPAEVEVACRNLGATNTLEGVVLDLRYADGSDYAAAIATAGLFAGRSVSRLDWGAGMVSATVHSNSIRVPVAVLVNHETAQAAEALAALLRESGAGLILGSGTAGCAMIMENFPLAEGGLLRIAAAPVRLGDGTALDSAGIQPDIPVTVGPEAEGAYFADPFLASRSGAPGSAGVTNAAASRGHLNEAELVREHREGTDQNDDGEALPARPAEAPKPVVTDPVLARALDLLKGLAVVREGRS